MTRKAKTTRRRRMPDISRAFFIGCAQQKYNDEKARLFDLYDYDNISRSEYDRRLKEAYEEYQEAVRFANGES